MNSVIAQVEQIDIPRVELMPGEPTPYSMRDWKKIAIAYDSFVYDITKTGLYLPLVFIKPQGLNYPEHPNFGLDTYVGTFSPENGEAINVLPSLVSGTLMGADKTNQFGNNWILFSQDYFNKANGENLYLNNIGGHSGGDWWYDMMPNIFFYQLYDLYGKIGDAESQFIQVADRMAEGVSVMGGKATPWTRAFMDYRAYDFLHMQPNPNGVHEPEAAGAFTWLLYHAFKETGDETYLRAAEWSMEYLINLNTNPSYELQLPYGAYIAAKMNAEIGTEYNIEKLLFWVFHRGPLRGWGTIVGNWNGFDVSGLVGEANDAGNDYAFLLNGFQQAGQLAPLARYDKRFSRTIGKWILNVANASRLMFPHFLADQLQDASAWSNEYDPEGVIGYEALREVWMGNSPFSTGDALRNGWAATNLSLYSTSSIGYLASIIEQTNEEKILQIDLVKADFFGEPAYPSYLYYNPFNTTKSVALNLPLSSRDIYDVISETFLAKDVSGQVILSIPPDSVISIVIAPSNGTITYDNNKMLINGIIVDFMQTTIPYNYPPRIQALALENNVVEKNSTVSIFGKAIDQETKDLIYTFILPGDTISGLEKTVSWTAPDSEGSFEIKLFVEDEGMKKDTALITVEIVEEINIAPEIIELTASKIRAGFGETIHFSSNVMDENGDSISYTWTQDVGVFLSAESAFDWITPNTAGIRTIRLTVTDNKGGIATGTIQIAILDPALQQSGQLIAWYPFAGNPLDISGNELHGQRFGALPTADFLGNTNQAFFFDGINDHIRVPFDPKLNFNSGITVSLFAKPQTIGDKERYLISHGSYQNRWKISITPEQKLRWTVKNELGQIADLDSETILEAGTNYHIGVTYDAWFMMLYINGTLETFTSFPGNINESLLALEIGQQLPDDQNYNYSGVLDEIKIYDFALTPDSIASESALLISSVEENIPANKTEISLYPNPAFNMLTIELNGVDDLIRSNSGIITILDLWGRTVFTTKAGDATRQTISISSIPSGIYILRISYPGATYLKECIIHH